MTVRTSLNMTETTGSRTTYRTKRTRSLDEDESSSEFSHSSSPTPTPKAQRVYTAPGNLGASVNIGVSGPGRGHPLLCNLPPTCDPPVNKPTPLADTKELEEHYAKCHAHVCSDKKCRAIFPDERLLELHITENHDPIAATRRDRGEKIFACHLKSCSTMFLTPKGRRNHIIQVHKYPKEYFFAITNKGVGGLLKKWGEGASLLRGEWKPRDEMDADEENMNAEGDDSGGTFDEEIDTEDDTRKQIGGQRRRNVGHPGPSGERRGNGKSRAQEIASAYDRDATQSMYYAQARVHEAPPYFVLPEENVDNERTATMDSIDSLADNMDSLSLIPPRIQFGRGGRATGFARGGGQYGQVQSRGRGNTHRGSGRGYNEQQGGYRGNGRGITGTRGVGSGGGLNDQPEDFGPHGTKNFNGRGRVARGGTNANGHSRGHYTQAEHTRPTYGRSNYEDVGGHSDLNEMDMNDHDDENNNGSNSGEAATINIDGALQALQAERSASEARYTFIDYNTGGSGRGSGSGNRGRTSNSRELPDRRRGRGYGRGGRVGSRARGNTI